MGPGVGGVAISDGKTTLVIPSPEAAHLQEVCALFHAAEHVVVHDWKAWMRLFARMGIADLCLKTEQVFDLQMAHYLLAAHERDHGLASVLERFVGSRAAHMPEFFDTDKDFQRAGEVAASLLAVEEKAEKERKMKELETDLLEVKNLMRDRLTELRDYARQLKDHSEQPPLSSADREQRVATVTVESEALTALVREFDTVSVAPRPEAPKGQGRP
jgi:DNA polymerase I-like protein with 3'-5' exonuclease and polymerase domains